MRTPESRTLDALHPRALRAALGRFATGVAVVTAAAPDGTPIGMTVNSLTSVSLDPPLVLFCVDRRSRLHPVFTGADGFAVNILREGQLSLSWRFASPGFDRFDAIEPRYGETGVPLLPSALAVLECVEPRPIPAGDHDIVLGRVVALETAPDDHAEPLVFFGGGYRSLNTDLQWWSAWHE
ncbi:MULTISPECIES: flavin reductase family protein [Actinomadura]|uniref:Flavin reductase family protein n=1 Tax=Actinomadura yumaensis TaxID=111807 RepID=A0ABW2CP79_9ACTN|nr:flavin reductase family protein [Actinomadura sp. J1-007]MWK36709.1 flavin reductase [Actinomadura sp. J1-007]